MAYSKPLPVTPKQAQTRKPSKPKPLITDYASL